MYFLAVHGAQAQALLQIDKCLQTKMPVQEVVALSVLTSLIAGSLFLLTP